MAITVSIVEDNDQLRGTLARAFASLRSKRLSNPWKKHDNIPL